MLKGGVIMDVVTPEEARIAEEAGAVAVMALERVPADIRKEGGVARMSDPEVRWEGGLGGAGRAPLLRPAASWEGQPSHPLGGAWLRCWAGGRMGGCWRGLGGGRR